MTEDVIVAAHNKAETADPGIGAAPNATTSIPPADVQATNPRATRRRTLAQNSQRTPGEAKHPSGISFRSEVSKTEIVLKKLRLARGATVAQIMEATGWQAHSVRGFLSAVVRKKRGLDLTREIGKDGQCRYRIAESSGAPTC